MATSAACRRSIPSSWDVPGLTTGWTWVDQDRGERGTKNGPSLLNLLNQGKELSPSERCERGGSSRSFVLASARNSWTRTAIHENCIVGMRPCQDPHCWASNCWPEPCHLLVKLKPPNVFKPGRREASSYTDPENHKFVEENQPYRVPCPCEFSGV